MTEGAGKPAHALAAVFLSVCDLAQQEADRFADVGHSLRSGPVPVRNRSIAARHKFPPDGEQHR